MMGPTYAEMAAPGRLPSSVRRTAAMAARDAPEHATALFATHWYLLDGCVHALPLPPGLVGHGVSAVVLASDHFATGSVHAGVAWALWMERLLSSSPVDAAPSRPAEGPMAQACDWVAARLATPWGSGRPLDAADAWAPYRYHTAVTARAIDAVFEAWQPSGARVVVSGCGSAGAFLAVDALRSDAAWVRVSTTAEPRPTRVEDRAVATAFIDPDDALALAQVLTGAPDQWTSWVELDAVEGAALVGRLGTSTCAHVLAARAAVRRMGLGPGDVVVLVAADAPMSRPSPGTVASESHLARVRRALTNQSEAAWLKGGAGPAAASLDDRARARAQAGIIDAALQARRGG
jgi:hypothetical protein